MKLHLLPASVLLLTACDVKVNNPPAQPPVVEKNTTVVTPPAEKKVESNTTINVAPPAEKKTETNTTIVNPPAPK